MGDGRANSRRDVQKVQRALGALGHLAEDPFDRPHGYWDGKTYNAVRAFQDAGKLKVDGYLLPAGETEQALDGAVERLAAGNAAAWREYWTRAARARTLSAAGDAIEQSATARMAGIRDRTSSARVTDDAIELTGDDFRDGRRHAPQGDRGYGNPRVQYADAAPAEASDVDPPYPPIGGVPTIQDYDPEDNFARGQFPRNSREPGPPRPPTYPLKPDIDPQGGEWDLSFPSHRGDQPQYPAGIDRARAVRGLIDVMYRIAPDDDGVHRMPDKEFQAYLEAAREHIKIEYFPIFEMTARAVRAGVLDSGTASTKLTDYLAPFTTTENFIGLVADMAPIVGTIKGAAALHEALRKIVDAEKYGNTKARDAAVEDAATELVLLAFPGMAAIAARKLVRTTNKHHMIFKYLGGIQRQKLLVLDRWQHEDLHSHAQAYFRVHFPDLALNGKRGRKWIKRNTNIDERLEGLDSFYKSLKNSPLDYEQRAFQLWDEIFPEARKFIRR